ncbi:enoyl-CoA hydratase/isomerase family protein [Cohaesibacter sp. CAU 1516]|uniref:enoyl-CoA hydratase/isomerase family protein n=1 Tax=Cohaesibacter sp. CAU 1516 TaxID=2576038 RepID=UPI0010FED006|nr:enoyl-CoA hydratase/isomerase family protein [Cohaesibacter sp. CAU 1516]TLP43401.1 enoyl-CoA hydratase/isomerase family protein [Cohaesibacter sp. CAU 1516]
MNDILFEQRGVVGLVTLNRVKALNALSHDMIVQLTDQLDAWRENDNIKAVIVTSASEKAFCAGGDIRHMWERKGNPPFEFFYAEYRLNQKIFRYPKPYLSLIDGIVMGGGVGISLHGQYRVAGEGIRFAMPEVGIGFFPDVGGSYLLPRMKGKSGTYCAMSGARLKQGACLDLGLVTHAVTASKHASIIERVAAGEAVDAVLADLAENVPSELSDAEMATINTAFAAANVSDIVAALEDDPSEFAQTTLKVIRSKSPTSVHVAFEQVMRGAKLDFEDCMRLEYRIVHRILQDEDFYEGVRATIVDKDGAPKWNPADLESVNPSLIAAHFEPLDGPELEFETQ